MINELGRFARGGVLAGVLSAALNLVYFALFVHVSGMAAREPTVISIVSSSVGPPVLASLGLFVLTRFTRHAVAIFVAITLSITAASFLAVFAPALPDGTPKPAGFDLLVMPMHALVGGVTSWLVPRFVRRSTPSKAPL
jgi:hypothetical protein